MTRFHFGQTTDIQVHDTYFVVANVHLLVVVGLVLIVAYSLTLGLKKLATFHNKLKILSALITGTIALGFSLLETLMTIIVLEYPTETWHALYYGIMLLWIGLVVLFTLRTIEILKKVT